MGIDYGTKRVGVAFSDETGRIAFPEKVLLRGSDLPAELARLAREMKAETVVLGESVDFGGRSNPLMTAILALKTFLIQEGFVVILEPEYSSSVEATRFQGENSLTDASAAAIILQRYLDRQTNN